MKKIYFIISIISLLFAWGGPLPSLSQHAFFAHMIMHMTVVAIAAPLMSFSLIGTHFDKSSKYPRIFSPIFVSVIELIVVWGWHAPRLHHIARHTNWGLIVEQSMFFITGVWLWFSAYSANKGAGVISLLLTSMHMTLLGALLAFAPRLLYEHHIGFRTLSALEDQHMGGVVMLVVGGVSYLVGGLVLTSSLLKMKTAISEV